ILLIGLAASPVQAADLLTVARDALANDAGLAAARAEPERVSAGREIERGGLLPQLSASSNVTHNRNHSSQGSGFSSAGEVPEDIHFRRDDDDNFNSFSIGLEASQALYNANRFALVERAER